MLSKHLRTVTLAAAASLTTWCAQAQHSVAQPTAAAASQAVAATPPAVAVQASTPTSPYPPGSIGAWAYSTTQAAENAQGPVDLVVGVFGRGLLIYLGGGVALVLLVLALTFGRRSKSLG